MNRSQQLALHLAAIGLLGLALLRMPYGYYTFLRIAVCVLLGGILYAHHERKSITWTLICGAVIIVYNPIIRIHLTRDTWAGINLATIAVAVVSAGVLWMAHRTTEHK
jgi:hypothetical protein